MGCGASRLPAVVEDNLTSQQSSIRLADLETDYSLLDDLSDSQLYTDHEFPPHTQVYGDIAALLVWKRPSYLVANPSMFVSGSSPGDIIQGIMGDCWFLSACAALSQNNDFMNKVVPAGQTLCGDQYSGRVQFRFWNFGRWIDVLIDDRLPTLNGELVFAHSADEDEFWVALMEKAYAKLHGSYNNLEGGRATDAFVDLTGGFSNSYQLNHSDLLLYKKMRKTKGQGGIIACSKKGKWKQSRLDMVDEYGLVSGHAYTVSDVQVVVHMYGKEHLVKVRNPWGGETEWKGPWSDGDSCWDWVSEEDRTALEVEDRPDGEFWMGFDDFCHHFNEITICSATPDFDSDHLTEKSAMAEVRGEWVEGYSAGGCRNCMEAFATNPQFLIELNGDDVCFLYIGLMQTCKDRRSLKQIGFFIYKGRELLGYDQLCSEEVGKSGVFINYREVNASFELEAGTYVLVPSTFNPGDAGRFLIRLYAKNASLEAGALRDGSVPTSGE